MTKRAYVLTSWVGTGAFLDPNRPAISDAYPVLTYQDVTGHPSAAIPPAPNLFVADCTVDDATATTIAADANYRFLTVDQWGLVPGAAGYTAFTNWLVTKTGRTLAQVQAVIGSTVSGRTWGEIITQLIGWLQTRPHQ